MCSQLLLLARVGPPTTAPQPAETRHSVIKHFQNWNITNNSVKSILSIWNNFIVIFIFLSIFYCYSVFFLFPQRPHILWTHLRLWGWEGSPTFSPCSVIIFMRDKAVCFNALQSPALGLQSAAVEITGPGAGMRPRCFHSFTSHDKAKSKSFRIELIWIITWNQKYISKNNSWKIKDNW